MAGHNAATKLAETALSSVVTVATKTATVTTNEKLPRTIKETRAIATEAMVQLTGRSKEEFSTLTMPAVYKILLENLDLNGSLAAQCERLPGDVLVRLNFLIEECHLM